MQNEPTVKLRVVNTDTKLGMSIESSCPDFYDDLSVSHATTKLTLVTSKSEEIISYTSRPVAREVISLLSKVTELRVCPTIVSRLASMIGDITVTPSDIENLIKRDKLVAARTLNLANSGYYPLPRTIYFLREILVFLGYMPVRNLAMQAAMLNLFRDDPTKKLKIRTELWHHSLDTALLSRKIAEHMGMMERTSVGGELAFNAGLLHDIGKLAFSLIMPDEYLSTYKEQQKLSVPFIEIERNYLPFSHTVFGEALAQQWNLPEVISDSIAFHHTPGNSQLHPELAATVCLADELSHAINTSDNHTAVSLDVFDAVNPSACAVLGLQRREIHELVDICKAELVKARFLHEIEIS